MPERQTATDHIGLNKKGFLRPKAVNKVIHLSGHKKQNARPAACKADLVVGELNVLTDSKLLSSNLVRVYRGLDGVCKAYSDFLDGLIEGDEICNYVSPAPVTMKGYREGMRKFIKKRIRKQVFSKTICSYGEDAIRLKLTDDYSLRKTLVSFESVHHSFFSEILMCKDRILGASYSGDVAFAYLMLDKDIAAMHQAVFNLAWRQARLEDARLCQTQEIKDMMGSLKGIRDY